MLNVRYLVSHAKCTVSDILCVLSSNPRYFLSGDGDFADAVSRALRTSPSGSLLVMCPRESNRNFGSLFLMALLVSAFSLLTSDFWFLMTVVSTGTSSTFVFLLACDSGESSLFLIAKALFDVLSNKSSSFLRSCCTNSAESVLSQTGYNCEINFCVCLILSRLDN